MQWALVIDAASFAVSLAATFAMRVTAVPAAGGPAERASFGRELAAGLRFFRGSPVLVAVGVGVVVATLGTGAINVLTVYFLKANLHAAPKWLGALDAAEGPGPCWARWQQPGLRPGSGLVGCSGQADCWRSGPGAAPCRRVPSR
ncbi:MAG: hypothetical protein ACRDOK_30380 [Streptosporangiaceae bacterium]